MKTITVVGAIAGAVLLTILGVKHGLGVEFLESAILWSGLMVIGLK